MKQDYELCGSVKIWFYRTHTVNHHGAYLAVPGYCHEVFNMSYTSGEYLAQKLKELGLAKDLRGNGDMVITTRGREIQESGGYENWNEFQLNRIKQEKEARNTKEELDSLKILAETEKLNYEKSRRELDKENQRLSTLNLKLQNADYMGKWVIGLVSFLVGFGSYDFTLGMRKIVQWTSNILLLLGI